MAECYRITTNGGTPIHTARTVAEAQLAVLRNFRHFPCYVRLAGEPYVLTFRDGHAPTCHLHGVALDRAEWPAFATQFATAIERAYQPRYQPA